VNEQSVKEEAVPFAVRFVKAMMGEAVADPAQVIVTPNKDIEPVPLQETDEPVVELFIWDWIALRRTELTVMAALGVTFCVTTVL
jgi:hypothetical protein